jgi:CheY-like chemotaxis protein
LHYQLASWGALDTSVSHATPALVELRAAADAGAMYDLIVVDRQMPEIDGLTLAREIRTTEATCAVPIVMMTSVGELGEREALESLGLAAYLLKPVKATHVREVLIAALGGPGPSGAASSIRESSATLAPAQLLHGRVLVAEDNPINQKVALLQLRRIGCTADAVGNGAEAVVALATIPYDLVLMDCQMPDVDGFEATRQIRAWEAGTTRRIPVIAMTANAVEGDRDRCLDAGMDDYISKPVKASDLNALLRKWLRQGEAVISGTPGDR